MPDGKPYENTEGCWKYLSQASNVARYLGLVPISDFDDKRNPPPSLYLPEPVLAIDFRGRGHLRAPIGRRMANGAVLLVETWWRILQIEPPRNVLNSRVATS